MKSLIFIALALCLPARATLIFTITDPVNHEVDQANAHQEESWNFTTLAGWSQDLVIDSVTVQENFTLIIPGGTPATPNFQSTIIHDTNPLGTQSAMFTIFAAQNLTTTSKTATLTPGVGGFTDADITANGELGEFATRVARNGGGFFLTSMTITIDASTPEPAVFAMTGLGLLALFWKIAQRPVTSRITRR